MTNRMNRTMSFLAVSMISVPILVGCGKKSAAASSSSSAITAQTCPASGHAIEGFSSFSVPSHIPQAVRRFSDQGKFSEDQELSVTVALALNNPNDLKQQLQDLYDFRSPSYHQFLTSDEFRARYAPTSDQVASVASFLASRGLHDFVLNPNGYLLQTKGSVGALNVAFSTEIHQYQEADGTQHFAPAVEPMLPVSLPIQSVLGLDDVAHLKSHLRVSANGVSPFGTGPLGGLSPSDIKTAYNIPGSVNGSGQTLGLFELDGYTASDITTYETNFGIGAVTLQNVLVDGASGAAGSGQR